MKIKEAFTILKKGNNTILVDSSGENFLGQLRINDTAEFIVKCLRSETTIKKIVAAALEIYDGSASEITADVESMISMLRSINALLE